MLTSCWLRSRPFIHAIISNTSLPHSPVQLHSFVRLVHQLPKPLPQSIVGFSWNLHTIVAMNRHQYGRQHHHQHHQQQQQRHQHNHPASRWEDAASTDPACGPKPKNDPHQLNITVMSYNVLAQHLIDVHRDLYARHQPRHLNWPHRFERIMEEVRHVKPDVLCLQEVQFDHLPQFVRHLRDKCHLDAHIYQKRTDDSYRDGCAIFYNSAKLLLCSADRIEYRQPFGGALLDRPNVAVMAHFRSPHNWRQRLVVATTHLLWNPRREDVRVAQAQLLLAELDRCAYLGRDERSGEPVYAPVIVTGDLNSTPEGAVVRLLCEGRLNYARRLGTRLAAEEGDGRRGDEFGERLLPLELAITDGCQHGVLALGPRVAGVEASATWLNNSHTNQLHEPAHIPTILDSGLPFQTGQLQHGFCFRSVYEPLGEADANAKPPPHHAHRPAPRTATTFHEAWITVDYLLYSRRATGRGRQSPAGDSAALQLLQRLRVPTVGECQQQLGRIPNAEHGSDHVAVAARFRLGESSWLEAAADGCGEVSDSVFGA